MFSGLPGLGIGGQRQNGLKLFGGEYRNRTGLHGFAIRCITYLPTRRPAHHLRLPRAKVKGIRAALV